MGKSFLDKIKSKFKKGDEDDEFEDELEEGVEYEDEDDESEQESDEPKSITFKIINAVKSKLKKKKLEDDEEDEYEDVTDDSDSTGEFNLDDKDPEQTLSEEGTATDLEMSGDQTDTGMTLTDEEFDGDSTNPNITIPSDTSMDSDRTGDMDLGEFDLDEEFEDGQDERDFKDKVLGKLEELRGQIQLKLGRNKSLSKKVDEDDDALVDEAAKKKKKFIYIIAGVAILLAVLLAPSEDDNGDVVKKPKTSKSAKKGKKRKRNKKTDKGNKKEKLAVKKRIVKKKIKKEVIPVKKEEPAKVVVVPPKKKVDVSDDLDMFLDEDERSGPDLKQKKSSPKAVDVLSRVIDKISDKAAETEIEEPEEEVAEVEEPEEEEIEVDEENKDIVNKEDQKPKSAKEISDKILSQLEIQIKAKMAQEGETVKLGLPTDFEEKGRGLVYSCKGGHWACVNSINYFRCGNNYKYYKGQRQPPTCFPENVYLTDENCVMAQDRMINLNIKTKFCQ